MANRTEVHHTSVGGGCCRGRYCRRTSGHGRSRAGLSRQRSPPRRRPWPPILSRPPVTAAAAFTAAATAAVTAAAGTAIAAGVTGSAGAGNGQ